MNKTRFVIRCTYIILKNKINLVDRFWTVSSMIISLSSLGLHSCEQYVNFDLTRVTYRFRLVSMGVDCMWNVRRI